MSLCVVITSIQAPTTGVKEIAKRLVETGGRLVVVGDKKSPQGWFCPSVDYLSSQTQMGLSFATAKAVPVNSYSRKMLGYLVAASGGSSSIQETDDDNRPLESFFNPFSDSIEARLPLKHNKWLNIYSYFTDRFIWPRGFPLCEVYSETYQPELVTKITTVAQPFVLQAVADGEQ